MKKPLLGVVVLHRAAGRLSRGGRRRTLERAATSPPIAPTVTAPNGRSLGSDAQPRRPPQGEIVQLVKEFRDGKRPATVMQQLAKGYTDAQIEAVAAYLAAQKP